MRDKYKEIPILQGFMNNREDGGGRYINFIFSNGDTSTQYDYDYETKYKFMI